MKTSPGYEIRMPRSRTLAQVCVAAALLVVIFLAGSVILTRGLSHDEHMYLSAAKMLNRGTLYADFAYLQTPYMPFVYNFVISVIQSGSILLVARVTKVAVVVALLLVVFRLAAHLSSDRWFALACVFLLFENDIFRHTIGYARNYDLPMLFVLLAGWLILSSRSHPLTMLAHAGAGFLVGLAIGTKLTYALIPFAFVLLILVDYKINKRSVVLLASFSLGVGVALVPAILLSVDAGIDRAWFNNLGYHHFNTTWRVETGYEKAMSFIGKIKDAKRTLWTVPSQFLLLLGLFVSAVIITEKRSSGPLLKVGPFLWCIALFLVAILMVVVPTPVWKSYYSPLVIFSVLLVAALYSQLSTQNQRTARLLAFACVFMLLTFNFSSHIGLVRSAVRPAEWPCVMIHEEGLALRQAVHQGGGACPVATLSPVYALEAGLDIYPELATGPFAYRIGELLSDDEIQRFRTTSAQHIGGLLEQCPPSAILVGFEAALDTRLEEFAVQNGYERHKGLIGGAKIYIPQNNRIESDEE